MSRLRALQSSESGVALVTVVLIGAVMTLLAAVLIDQVTAEGARSSRSMDGSAAYQAAEAGVEDYIAKLTEDRLYFQNFTHPGEATRRSDGGNIVPAGRTWTYGTRWTYPNGKDAWRSLRNGYEYNLEVIPPSAGSEAIKIVGTGRRAGSATGWRALEVSVRQANVADFRMIANADISYGSTASTYGKIYAGIDDSGNAHDVDHDGTAYDDIYAEGRVTGSVTMMNGAQKYGAATIRTKIKNPIRFSSFVFALTEIQAAAQAAGLYFNDASVHGWRMTFNADGTVRVERCTRNSGRNLAELAPNCSSPATYTLPPNGAIYVGQSAIVSGQVNGRVTVAANQDVVIGNNISYVTSGDDVLGLIANNEMIVAAWVPYDLSWRAGTIAQNGMWRSWNSGNTHGTMTFTGSTATNDGGYMSQFRTRVYDYDPTLLYLSPPWFPAIEDSYTVLMFREVAP
jgi:hypothetical protein